MDEEMTGQRFCNLLKVSTNKEPGWNPNPVISPSGSLHLDGICLNTEAGNTLIWVLGILYFMHYLEPPVVM